MRGRGKRHRAIHVLIVALAVTVCATVVGLAACGSSEPASTESDTEARGGFLYVQSAEEASFSGAGRAMKLTLREASSTTTAFADAPRRDAFTLPTVFFSHSFERRFRSGAPNATVSSIETDVGEFVVELSEPKLTGDRTLVYSVKPIEPRTGLPARTGPVSVFIDADTVTSPVRVSGTVQLPDGSGLAGASIEDVFEEPECGWSCHETLRSLYVATTDANGDFSVEDSFNISTPYTFRASKPGYTSDEVTKPLREDGTFFEFELAESP